MPGSPRDPSSLLHGSVVLDAPERVPAIWGSGDEVLWAEGEPLVIAGPPGVGKTTLAQQVALARAGVLPDLNVLNYPVEPRGDGRTLYVNADRPRQALRSMRRMVSPTRGTRELLDGLCFWDGPPFTLADPEDLAAFLYENAIGTVVLDSIKDVAGDVSEGKVGAEFNRAVQTLIAAGIEVLAIHHSRKGQEGNRKPKRLDDLYGSTWIAAGAGSVVYLYGEAGDPIVELLHLKQPAAPVGPLTVAHDHLRGRSTAAGGNARELVEAAPEGVSIKAVAESLFATVEPSRAQVEKARRQLDRLVREGFAEKVEGDGDKAPATFRALAPTPETVITRDSDRDRSRSDHAGAENGLTKHHAAITGDHTPRSDAPDPPLGGGGRP